MPGSSVVHLQCRLENICSELHLPNEEWTRICPRHDDKNACILLRLILQRLYEHKNRTLNVLRSIQYREHVFETLLNELSSSEANKGIKSYQKDRVLDAVKENSTASVQTIKLIQEWRRGLTAQYPFMWRNQNYILKIRDDNSRIAARIQDMNLPLLTGSLLLPPVAIDQTVSPDYDCESESSCLLQLWLETQEECKGGEPVNVLVRMSARETSEALLAEAAILYEADSPWRSLTSLTDLVTPILKGYEDDLASVASLAHQCKPSAVLLESRLPEGSCEQKRSVFFRSLRRQDPGEKEPLRCRVQLRKRPASASPASSTWVDPCVVCSRSTAPQRPQSALVQSSVRGPSHVAGTVLGESLPAPQSGPEPLRPPRPPGALRTKLRRLPQSSGSSIRGGSVADGQLKSGSADQRDVDTVRLLRDLFADVSAPLHRALPRGGDGACRYYENSGRIEFGPDLGDCRRALQRLGVCPQPLTHGGVSRLYRDVRAAARPSAGNVLTFAQFCSLIEAAAERLDTTLRGLLFRIPGWAGPSKSLVSRPGPCGSTRAVQQSVESPGTASASLTGVA